jgi:anthranilate/para-aminobenzoate synthase component I
MKVIQLKKTKNNTSRKKIQEEQAKISFENAVKQLNEYAEQGLAIQIFISERSAFFMNASNKSTFETNRFVCCFSVFPND